MTAPELAVFFAPGFTWQAEPASITWVNITAYVLHDGRVRVRRGASSARGAVDVGQLSLVLKNTDRRFDPTHGTGPYYGDLVPGVPIKIFGETDETGYVTTYASAFEADTAPVFSGTVARWPQRFDLGGQLITVPVEAFDGFDKFSRAKIPQAVYPLEVLADSPVAYWRLDETSGTTMVDSSGADVHGIYDNATIGEDPLIEDGNGKSVFCTLDGDNRGQYKGADLPVAAPVTLEAWVKFDRDLTEWHTILVVQRDNAFGSGLWLLVAESADGSPNGELVIDFRGLGGFYKARGDTRIDDGETHHVVMTMSSTAAADIKLYVDGVEQTKTVISGATGGSWGGHHLWAVANVAAGLAFESGLGGNIDEVAIYSSALSAARVLAHYEAGAEALAGQRTDERIGYILDALDWPTNLRDMETGHTLLGAATFQAGDSALEYLRLINASEDGLLFIDPSGNVRFLDRYWKFLDTLATTSQFTFTDASGSTSYAEFDLDIDDDLLVNVARVTRRGGAEQAAENATSVDAYGPAESQVSDVLVQTDAQALSLAEWLVASRGTPLPRVPKIRVPLHRYSAANQLTVLNLDLGHRVSVVRTPAEGVAIDLDFVIDGISHDIGGGEWWWEAFVSPVPEDTLTPFIWGTSEWGGTDVWAY